MKSINIVLKINERISINGLFPQKTNLVTQVLIKDIADKVKIGQKEAEKIDLKINENIGSYTWKKELSETKAIDFTAREIVFLQEQIERLDKTKEITQQILSLCLKLKEV